MPASVPTTKPPAGDGWRIWHAGVVLGIPPAYYVEIEIWRRGWRQAELVDPMQLSPSFNVANLHWRPADQMRDMAAWYRRTHSARK